MNKVPEGYEIQEIVRMHGYYRLINFEIETRKIHTIIPIATREVLEDLGLWDTVKHENLYG